MVGSGIKKFAAENGLRVEKGAACGLYGRYLITLREGGGWKSVTFAARLPDESAKGLVHAWLNDAGIRKSYRIKNYSLTNVLVTVTVLDNPGTMPRLRELIGLLAQKLESCGAAGAEVCSSCGMAFAGGEAQTVLIDGNVFAMHSGCVERLAGQMREQAEAVRASGSVLTGALGAVLGAVVGSIPWAVAYYYGWFVGWLGFLIGFCAQKGYDLLKGKKTGAKGAVVLIVTLLAVVFAEFATLFVSLRLDPQIAEMGFTAAQTVSLIMESIRVSAEVSGPIIRDVLLGWLFALLGIWGLVKDIFARSKNLNGSPVRIEGLLK